MSINFDGKRTLTDEHGEKYWIIGLTDIDESLDFIRERHPYFHIIRLYLVVIKYDYIEKESFDFNRRFDSSMQPKELCSLFNKWELNELVINNDGDILSVDLKYH